MIDLLRRLFSRLWDVAVGLAAIVLVLLAGAVTLYYAFCTECSALSWLPGFFVP